MPKKPDISLVIEPWTTANTHFHLHIEEQNGSDKLMVKYNGKTYQPNSNNTFCGLTFNGQYDDNSGEQTANLKFTLKGTKHTFRKQDNGIKNHSPENNFTFNATLVENDSSVIVTIARVNIESSNFNFNFDIVSDGGKSEHVFDPEISIGRPPHP